MRKMILFGAVVLSATVLIARTQKPAPATNAPAKNAAKFVPFNMRLGLWQDTMTTTSTGSMGIPPNLAAKLTPQQIAQYQAAMGQMTNGVPRTITYKKCVKPDDLKSDPFSNPRQHCTWTTLTSTGSSGQAIGTCLIEDKNGNGTMDINIKYRIFNSETLEGSGTFALTFNGHTINTKGSLSGKWLGSTCPAGVD